MTTLDELAPYPTTEQDATSDALIRYLSVRAYARHVTITSPPDGASQEELKTWWLEMGVFSSEFAVLSLLRFLQDFHKDAADDAAREVWAAWRDGGVMPELVGDWLRAHKISPAAVEKAAKRARTESETETKATQA